MDYSTSGLENPLSHLILAVFLLVYLKSESSPRTLWALSSVAALGMLNRMDTGLLYLPALGFALFETRSSIAERLRAVMAGLIPFALWELFSLFYYGSLVPNTAYAKLNLGIISQTELLKFGFYYFLNSLNWDPVTLLVISAGILAPFALKKGRLLPVAAGPILYLLYVWRIGGDFMSGRFFAEPLLVAVALLMNTETDAGEAGRRFALLALIALIGLSSPYSPVLRPAQQPMRDKSGVSDEKGNYWQNTGLLQANFFTPLPDHDWALEGRAARQSNPGIVKTGSVGFYGYFAGPAVHIVDLNALADPLLARLPPSDPAWSIGHYGRTLPEGYLESLETGENRIADPNLSLYYDKLSLIIRGNLLDLNRLREIWRLNTGAYDPYLDAFAYSRGETFVQRFEINNPTNRPFVYAYVWNNGSQ
ncbi:MAG: hypothetical protein AAB427_12680, partial [Chloroflexota bacterium]